MNIQQGGGTSANNLSPKEEAMMSDDMEMERRRAASREYVESLPKGTVEELQEQVLDLQRQLATMTAERDRLLANRTGSNMPTPKEGEPGYGGGGWIPCEQVEKP